MKEKRKKCYYLLTLIIISILCISGIKYIHSKTLWKGETDCMIEYVNKHYPHGCTYNVLFNGKRLPHIDKCWLENEFMVVTGKVEGCRMMYNEASPMGTLFNTPYCFISLTLEKLWTK